MNNNIIITASIILPSIIISITLLLPNRNKYALKFLAVFYLFQISILTFSSLILSSYEYVNLFPIGHIGNLFTFCLAPTVYLYIKKHLSKSKEMRATDFTHYIPFAIVLTYYLYMVIFKDYFYGKHFDQLKYKILESGQTILYFYLIFNFIKKQTGSIKEFFYEKKSGKHQWLKFIIVSSVVIFGVKLYTYLALEQWGNIGLYFSGISIYMVTALILITGYSFFVLTNPKILEIENKKNVNNILGKRIMEILLKDELFRDIDLNLSKISDLLNANEKEVSKAINENFKMNYYQLLNKLRIEKCIEIMTIEGNKDLSITDYQYEVGFSSKSTFFTNFKAFTGYTPLKYKKMLKKSS